MKLDENSQYGYGMTKPLAIGCTKQSSDISWRTFNLLMQNISLDNNTGLLYVVDIEFDQTKSTENQLIYNEVYLPIIEKQKIIDPCERSVYQLLEQYSATKKGNPRTYRVTKKAHAAILKKKFQLMCLEQFFFAVNRAGWHVTKIYSQYTFEQECLRKSFILMNQRSRQSAKNSIKKYF